MQTVALKGLKPKATQCASCPQGKLCEMGFFEKLCNSCNDNQVGNLRSALNSFPPDLNLPPCEGRKNMAET